MKSLMKRPEQKSRWLDPIFEDFFSAPSLFNRWDYEYSPRVNIRETEDQLAMTFEIPGMNKDDIKVRINDNVLSVSGTREDKHEDKDGSWIRREIMSGSFCRQFTLPNTVDTNSVNAEYRDGVLEITLEKREEAKPKEIDIAVS
ncbi:Hsp20 family protein [candidate division GN15 bacterium]|nr:Hsp20 family protein [candidate division GN15 bacterium]